MREGNRGLWILLGVLVLVAVLVPMLGGGIGMMGGGPGMMWGSGYSNGPGWGLWMVLGWLSMVAFLGAVILGVVLLARSLTGRSARTEDSALDVPRRRYAAGEITREQFESMRTDLERTEAIRR